MATPKKSAKRAPAKKAATKKSPAKKAPVRKAAAKKAPARKAPAAPTVRQVRPGFISHTELASTNPAATKEWASKALGWKFGTPMPTPNGDYHMWNFGDNTGGGIRTNSPGEAPGTIPYVEVTDIKAAFAKATREGATPMMPPDQVPGGMGWIAIVKAPGGVPIGFWATK